MWKRMPETLTLRLVPVTIGLKFESQIDFSPPGGAYER
jgi:hypothetical protein